MAAITATPNVAGGYVLLNLSGFGATTSANVVRIDAASNVVSVRNGDPLAISGGLASAQDYEAPTDSAVTYEARDVSTGATLATSSSTTLNSDGAVWLGHPGKPSLNTTFTIRGLDPGTRRARSGTYDVIGKTLPVTRSLRRSGPAGKLVLRMDTTAKRDALLDLVDDGYPLLLRLPTGWEYSAIYIAVGDVDIEQPTGIATDTLRFASMPWTQVDRPAGIAQAGPGFTWADVIATYATWTDVRTGNATWADVIDGVP